MVTLLIVALAVLVLVAFLMAVPRRRFGRRAGLGRGRLSGRGARRIGRPGPALPGRRGPPLTSPSVSAAEQWAKRDAAVVWHGFTQMASYTENAPVIVESADGHELVDV